MATINTFTASDTGSSILGDLNTNFENLNNDKIEAGSTDTLTNKSINATNNTITNLTTDTVAAASKTGSDAKFVTGTQGNDGEFGQWNSDGDLVSKGNSFTTTAPSSTSTDSTIPSSKAVHSAVQNVSGGFTERFFLPTGNSAGLSNNPFTATVGDFRVAQVTSTQEIFFTFRVPSNFVSLTELNVVLIADSTETIQYDLDSTYGAANSSHDTHDETEGNVNKSVTSGHIEEVDVSAVFSNLAANDYCGLRFQSDTDTLRVIGLYMKYAV